MIDDIINKIMKEKGYRHQYEVAKYFKISAQTLSGWVNQKKIPPKHLLKFYSEFENDTDKSDIKTINNNNINKDFIHKQKEKISLSGISKILFKNIKLLIWLPFTFTITTLIYLFFIANTVYKTTAVILPTSGSNQDMNGLLGAAAQIGMSMPLDLGNEIKWDEIYPEIVSSERLKRIVLQDTFKTNKYGSGQLLKSIIAKELNILNKTENKQLDEISRELDKLIIVNKTRFSSIVKLDVYGFEPEFTAAFADRIIYHSGRLQRGYKTKQINQKRQFLDDRIKAIEYEVKNAESALRLFREKNRHYNKSPTLILQEERLSQELALQRSLMVTLKSQFEKAKIEEVEKAAMIQVIDNPFIPWKHDSPKRAIVTIIFTFLGFFISVIIIYAKEYVFEME